MRLKADGYDNKHVEYFFYAVPIDGFATVGSPGRYTVTLDTMYAGEIHCLSLDFGSPVLEKILVRLPSNIRDNIRAQLKRDPHSAVQFIFPYAIYCDSVVATLREIQQAAQESFIPLVVREVKISSKLHPKAKLRLS